MINRPTEPPLFFSKAEKEKIKTAIQDAERETSGEIRVHLIKKSNNLLTEAPLLFDILGMDRTGLRNAVLILLATETKQFCIHGDRGIHEKVPENFWDSQIELLRHHFREDHFADGLCEVIKVLGMKLKEFFPYHRSDLNELPDTVSYG